MRERKSHQIMKHIADAQQLDLGVLVEELRRLIRGYRYSDTDGHIDVSYRLICVRDETNLFIPCVQVIQVYLRHNISLHPGTNRLMLPVSNSSDYNKPVIDLRKKFYKYFDSDEIRSLLPTLIDAVFEETDL